MKSMWYKISFLIFSLHVFNLTAMDFLRRKLKRQDNQLQPSNNVVLNDYFDESSENIFSISSKFGQVSIGILKYSLSELRSIVELESRTDDRKLVKS